MKKKNFLVLALAAFTFVFINTTPKNNIKIINNNLLFIFFI